ncbi:hypothetical protein XENOCAPTIV_027437, partial [Xenoophorus captivus]
GVHNGEYVSWLYCYDPVMDVWARKQDMNTKRAIHVLAGMNDRLYAIGGNHLKGCLQVFYHLLQPREGNVDGAGGRGCGALGGPSLLHSHPACLPSFQQMTTNPADER